MGGVLRFGWEGAIPTVRAGVGLHGASYGSRTAGTKPDDSVEFSGLFLFGAGVDYRVSEQFVIGSAATALLGGEELRTFEVGVHVRYGWTP